MLRARHTSRQFGILLNPRWPQFHTLCAMFSSIPILYFSSDRPGHPSSSLYSNPSALIRERMGKYLVCQKEFDQSGLWSNIFFGRDELGQVFKIYSNREGHQGTSARWLSGTLGSSLEGYLGCFYFVDNTWYSWDEHIHTCICSRLSGILGPILNSSSWVVA